MEPCMLQALICGTIGVDERRSFTVGRIIRQYRIRLQSGKWPLVYWFELVYDQGVPPSANELLKAIALMRKYVKNQDNVAYILDNALGKTPWPQSRTNRGERRHLAPSPEDNALRRATNKKPKDKYANPQFLRPSTSKVKHLEKFLVALEDRVNTVPLVHRDEPLNPPLSYAGFTIDPERLWKHESHDTASSNIKNLTLAALKYLFGRKRKFLTKPYIASFIYEREQSSLGEIIVAAIKDCYISSGRGFNIADAGDSNVGGLTMDPWREGLAWEWAFANTPLSHKLAQETAYMDRMTVKRKELARLKVIANAPDPFEFLMREAVLRRELEIMQQINTALDDAGIPDVPRPGASSSGQNASPEVDNSDLYDP